MRAYLLRFRLLLTGFLLFPAIQLFSWGVTGHRTVAQVAQNHLSKKAKKEIRALIGEESLAWWANWSDFIKSDSTWDHADPWHYVNVPGNLTRDQFVDTLMKQTGKNLYSQTVQMMKELGDKSLSIEQRRIALRFLIHLVGDLHQPLHVGRAADQGGNRITVYWFDRKTNLHSLWDNALVEFQQFSYTEYADNIDILSKSRIKEIQSGRLEDWFYESNRLADIIYASAANEAKLSYQYNFHYKKILDDQLLKGGLRLAELINQVFE